MKPFGWWRRIVVAFCFLLLGGPCNHLLADDPPTDVTGYETVTITIPATAYDASAGGPQMARVKYNKKFPLVITSDDMGKTELTNNWAAFNGYPVHTDKGGYPTGDDYLATPYSATYATDGSTLANYPPMTFTDDTGGTHRFTATSAIWPHYYNNTNYTLINATDAKTMLRTGWSFAQHDVDEATDAATIASCFAALSSTWATATGSAGLKIMVEPNGNHDYVAAGVSSSEICWNIFQNATTTYPNLSLALNDWAATRTDWTITGRQSDFTPFSNKPTGATERLFFQGHESEWTTKLNTALTGNDGSKIILGGTHGIGSDIMSHLKNTVQPADKAWVASADEVWEYYHIYNNAYIDNVSWSGSALTFQVHVPTYSKSMFRELTINIPGLTGGPTSTDGTVTTSGATVVTGSYRQNATQFTINLGLESRYLTYIDELTTLYRTDPSNLFVKRDAQYLIDLLWPGATKAAKQAALDATFDYSYRAVANLKESSTTIGTKTLSSGYYDAVTTTAYYFPRYILNGGSLYKSEGNGGYTQAGNTLSRWWYRNSVTVDAADIVQNVDYDKQTGTFVFFKEMEEVSGFNSGKIKTWPVNGSSVTNWNDFNGRASALGSSGAGVQLESGDSYGNGAGVSPNITTLSAGKYKITLGTFSSAASESGDSKHTILVDGVSVGTHQHTTSDTRLESTTNEFEVATDGQVVTISHNVSNRVCLDYIFIEKTGSLAPAVTLTASPSSAAYTGNAITLTANATLRGNSSLSSVEFQKKVDSGEWTALTTISSDLASGDDVTYAFTPDAAGTYQFRARATDNGSLTSDWVETSVITVTDPISTVSLTSSSDASPVVGSTVTLTATATPVSGVYTDVTYLAIEKSTDNGSSWTVVGDPYGTAPSPARAKVPRKASSTDEVTGEVTVTYSFTAVAGETAEYRATAIISGSPVKSSDAVVSGGDGTTLALATSTPSPRTLTFVVYKPDETVESNVSSTASASTIAYDATLATVFSSDANLKTLMRQYCDYTFYSDAALTNAITVADGQIGGSNTVYVKWTYSDNAIVFSSTEKTPEDYQYYIIQNNSNRRNGMEADGTAMTDNASLSVTDALNHWAFVGTPYSFKIYNRGKSIFLKVADDQKKKGGTISFTENVNEATEWQLTYIDWSIKPTESTPNYDWTGWGAYNGNFFQARIKGTTNINLANRQVSTDDHRWTRFWVERIVLPLRVYVDAAGNKDADQQKEAVVEYPKYSYDTETATLSLQSGKSDMFTKSTFSTAISQLVSSYSYTYYHDAACTDEFEDADAVSIFGGDTQTLKAMYALYISPSAPTVTCTTSSPSSVETGMVIHLSATPERHGGPALTQLKFQYKTTGGADSDWTDFDDAGATISNPVSGQTYTYDYTPTTIANYSFRAIVTDGTDTGISAADDAVPGHNDTGLVSVSVTAVDLTTLTFRMYDWQGDVEANVGTSGVISGIDNSSSTSETTLLSLLPTTAQRQYCQYKFYKDDYLTQEISTCGDLTNSTVYVQWTYTDHAPVFSTGSDADAFQYYALKTRNERLLYMSSETASTDNSRSATAENAGLHSSQWALVGTPYSFVIYNRGQQKYAGLRDKTVTYGDLASAQEWEMDAYMSGNAVIPVLDNASDGPEKWGVYNGQYFLCSKKGTTDTGYVLQLHSNSTVTGSTADNGNNRYCTLRLEYIVVPVTVKNSDGTTDTSNSTEKVLRYPFYATTTTSPSAGSETITVTNMSGLLDASYAYYTDDECITLLSGNPIDIFGGSLQNMKVVYAKVRTTVSVTYHVKDNASGQVVEFAGVERTLGDDASVLPAELERQGTKNVVLCSDDGYSTAITSGTSFTMSGPTDIYVTYDIDYDDDANAVINNLFSSLDLSTVHWFTVRNGADKTQAYYQMWYNGALNPNVRSNNTSANTALTITNDYQWAFVGTPYKFTIINRSAGTDYHVATSATAEESVANLSNDDTTNPYYYWELAPETGTTTSTLAIRQSGTDYNLFVGYYVNGQIRANGHLTVETQVTTYQVTCTLYDEEGTLTMGPESTLIEAGTEISSLPDDFKRKFCDYDIYDNYSEGTFSSPTTLPFTLSAPTTLYAKWHYADDAPVFSTGSDASTYQYYILKQNYYEHVSGETLNTVNPALTAINTDYQWALVGTPYSLKVYSRAAGKFLAAASTTSGTTITASAASEAALEWDLPFTTGDTNVNTAKFRVVGSSVYWGQCAISSTETTKTLTSIVVPLKVYQEDKTTNVDELAYLLDYPTASSTMLAPSLLVNGGTTNNANASNPIYRHGFCTYTFYDDAAMSNDITASGTSFFGGRSQSPRAVYATYVVDTEQFSQAWLTYRDDNGTKRWSHIDGGKKQVSAIGTVDDIRADNTKTYQWLLKGDPYNFQIANASMDETGPVALYPLGAKMTGWAADDNHYLHVTDDTDTYKYNTFELVENTAPNDDGLGEYYIQLIYDGVERHTGGITYPSGGNMSVNIGTLSSVGYGSTWLIPAVAQYNITWTVVDGSGTEVASLLVKNQYKGKVLTLADMPASLKRHFCEYTGIYTTAPTTVSNGSDSYTVSSTTPIYVQYTLDDGAPDFWTSTGVPEDNQTDYWYEIHYPAAGTNTGHIYYNGSGVGFDESSTISTIRANISYNRYRWALIGTPYGVKFYNMESDSYLTYDGSSVSLGATGTVFDLLDDYTGDLCAIWDEASGIYINRHGAAQANNTDGWTSCEFTNTYGLVKLTFVLHYSANTLRTDKANGTETILIENYQKKGKLLSAVLPEKWKRAFCDYTYYWNTSTSSSTYTSTATVTTVTDDMVTAYNNGSGSDIYVHVTYDYTNTTNAPFAWSTRDGQGTHTATDLHWYHVTNHHLQSGEMGKMLYQSSNTNSTHALRVDQGMVSDGFYTNNYKWCVIGDPYGFKMLCQYDPDEKKSEYLSVQNSDTDGNGYLNFVKEEGNDYCLFEMRYNPSMTSYFWMHPIYTSDLMNEEPDNISYLSCYGTSASPYLVSGGTAADAKGSGISNLTLKELLYNELIEYVRYAGFVGALRYDVVQGDETLKNVYDAIHYDGGNIRNSWYTYSGYTLTDGQIKDIHEKIEVADNMVQMQEGYYRIIPYMYEKGAVSGSTASRVYVRGYHYGSGTEGYDNAGNSESNAKHNRQEYVSDGYSANKALMANQTETKAEYDPATIFHFKSTAEGSYPRYIVTTQGMDLHGASLVSSSGANANYKCRYEDIGGVIMQLRTLDPANTNCYLSWVQNFGSTSTEQDPEAYRRMTTRPSFEMYKMTRLYLQPVGEESDNLMPLKLEMYPGKHTPEGSSEAQDYYFASIYVPYDLVLPSGDVYAYAGVKTKNDGQGSETDWRLQCEKLSEQTIGGVTYEKGKFIPAGTPALIRATTIEGTAPANGAADNYDRDHANEQSYYITLSIPNDAPATGLIADATFFKGQYLEQLLSGTAGTDIPGTDESVYIFGQATENDYENIPDDENRTLTDNSHPKLEAGFYINKNTVDGSTDYNSKRNNLYVRHNKIYLFEKTIETNYTSHYSGSNGAPTRRFIALDFGETGIEDQSQSWQTVPRTGVYDLQGRRVASAEEAADGSWRRKVTAGVYVVNGKKMVVHN